MGKQKYGKTGIQAKRDGAGGSVFVSRGGSVLISVEVFWCYMIGNISIVRYF
jgi:hypothetical protein